MCYDEIGIKIMAMSENHIVYRIMFSLRVHHTRTHTHTHTHAYIYNIHTCTYMFKYMYTNININKQV
jgi:hypothetical protein